MKQYDAILTTCPCCEHEFLAYNDDEVSCPLCDFEFIASCVFECID